MSAADDTELRRLRWRCRRGLLELDLLLLGFLNDHYGALDKTDQQAFQRLLWTPDNTLLAYLQGIDEPAEQDLKQIVRKIL